MAGTLTRSRIEAFDQTANQLSQYAARWRSAARDLDQAAHAYVSQISSPSGTQWQGQAAAAALDVAHTDRVSVIGAVMHAHDMADIAELGGSSLLGAREGALQAIAEAEAEDFSVGEDLSVADKRYRADPATYAARMAQAEAHLGYIEHHAGLLEAENQRLAAQLNVGAAQMNGMVPATWTTKSAPKAPENPRDLKPKFKAVDHSWKQGPPQPSISREQAKAGLKDVNRRIWEHNHIDKPVIETLPPNDPRRADFHIETEQLNAEKQQYLDALFRDHPPESIAGPHGERLPGVPSGQIPSGGADSGKGWTFPVQPGQAGIDPRIASIRVMEPTPQYPDGYAVYMNGIGQTVNPFTGRTVPPSDVFAHIPLTDQ